MKKYLIILAVLIVAVGLWFILPPLLHEDVEEEPPVPPPPPTVAEPEKPVSLSISAVGDVMVHRSQIDAQYDNATGTYNFDNNFEYVKRYIEGADLALCNLETTFAGGRYSGYPVFNTPDSLADALKKAGFDVAFTANNHIMDMGIDGMKRTLRVAREAGLVTTGTQLEGEKDYVVLTVNDMKIGVVAYLYETPEYEAIPTINSVPIPEDARPLLNTFNYNTLDEDLEKVKHSIEGARADGAEIVICYFHWGEEYQRSPNEYQQYMAMQAASFGADVIFASHPHVIQGMEMLAVAETGRKVPVFYSMGNFISNQRAETLDIRNPEYTEQEIIAEVRLEYMKSTKEILSVEMSAVPLWVERYKKDGKTAYYIIPLDNGMKENPALLESGHLPRAEQALTDITKLLGEEFIRTAE
ncbi:MAG TPA: CapA family protein [Anaerovoracaceae bacterium]|nr:CapA family protein [Anaerovoracaceae bacterium]